MKNYENGSIALLCTMLNCGTLDLNMLDDVQYEWNEVLEQMDWPRDGLDFNDVLRAVVDLGIIGIKDWIMTRIRTLNVSAYQDADTAKELDMLHSLDPDEDIYASFNLQDTHIWFNSHKDIYLEYLGEALEEFESNTGLSINQY